MFQLDSRDHRPLYEQIKEKIKELIISGALSEGDKIPSVRELAATLAINPNTIQKAYKDLENDGYIYSQRAKGSFVATQSSEAQNEKKAELFKNLEEIVGEMAYLKIDIDEIKGKINDIYKEVRL